MVDPASSITAPAGNAPAYTRGSSGDLKTKLRNSVKDPDLRNAIDRGVFDGLLEKVSGRNAQINVDNLSALLGTTAESLSSRYGPEVASTMMGSEYIDAISDMIASNCSSDQLVKAVVDFEAQVTKLLSDPVPGSPQSGCGLGVKGITRPMARAWINKTFHAQISNGKIKLTAGDATSMALKVRIGLDEFNELLAIGGLKITPEAFHYLLGTQSVDEKYSFEKDALPLENLTGRIINDVIPFIRNITGYVLSKLFNMFEETTFALIKKSDMSDAVKSRLLARIKKSIMDDASIKDQKTRDELIAQAERYVQKGDILALSGKIVKTVGGKPTVEKGHDFLEPLKDSRLVRNLIESSRNYSVDGSNRDVDGIFAGAGYATLLGDTDSIKSMFNAGKDVDPEEFDKLMMRFNKNLRGLKDPAERALYLKAMLTTITDVAENGEDGFPTYGNITAPAIFPRYRSIHEQLEWLVKDPKKVIENVRKIDREKNLSAGTITAPGLPPATSTPPTRTTVPGK